MPNAESAKLEIETSQTSVSMTALSDSGDHLDFTSSAGPWSQRSGFAPVIRPNGLINGGTVIPAVSGSDDVVDTAALLCNLNGTETSVAADTDVSITRPASAVSKVNSITVNSSGAIAVVAGTDGSTTAFSETRAAAGGPPLIPTDSIEIAQVRVTSDTSAAITTAEIFAAPGTHLELSNEPGYTVDYENGKLTFDSALPLIHTGPVAKAVYASYATAGFSEARRVVDWQPPQNSSTVNSTQYYNGVEASRSVSLGQGSFTAYLTDGITDTLVNLEGEILCFKFYQDRLKSPYQFAQGRLDMQTSFPVDNLISASCTISAETAYSKHAS